MLWHLDGMYEEIDDFWLEMHRCIDGCNCSNYIYNLGLYIESALSLITNKRLSSWTRGSSRMTS